ncbi:calcium-binding protein [Propionivibrio sp.]|uniref:calcium-binding protein n=1 Tax=Propionivibrio sp. TaxID=2212460 RepID=UPI0039E322F1
MGTVTYLSSATNETYSEEAFGFISTAKDYIRNAADALGISAGAIAGAMAEENTAYDWKDKALDLYAKSGFDPAMALLTFPGAMAGGAIAVAEWEATNVAQLATTRTHAQWQACYAAAEAFVGIPSLTDKIINPALIDAGPGNFKIATAIDIVVQHAGKAEYAALGLTQYLDDYAKLVEDLMRPTGELTAKLYGLYMKEYAEPFFKNNNAYAGQWESLPQTFRDALLVTYTNLGEAKMVELMKEPYQPQPALTTGGGMNHLHNATAIGSALGLVGYGDDAIGVSDFVSQAKSTGEAGLAARYALKQLRYVAIDGIDYSAYNADGSLDLYTSGGQITESWIADRAALLGWKTRYDTTKTAYGTKIAAEIAGDWDYTDYGTRDGADNPLRLSIDGNGIEVTNHQIVFGDSAANTLTGDGAADRLYGGAGDDTLEGAGGSDYLEGGSGNDTYRVGSGSDTILDTDRTGTVIFDGQTLTGGSRMGNTFVWASEGGEYLYTVDGADLRISSGTGDDGEVRIKDFLNGDLGIRLLGDGLAALYGRHDRVFGGAAGESISTFDQDDVVFADAGNDRVYAGTGSDIVYAGAGQDLVYGEAGDDLLFGDVSATAAGEADQLFGGDGRDLIDGHGGDDLLVGGNDIGDIYLPGETGQGDWVNGGTGNDTLYGSTRGDLLAGGAGQDTLYGGGGDDVLTGDGDYRPDYRVNYTQVVAYSAIQMGIELGILQATLMAQPGLYLDALNALKQLQSGETILPGGGIGADWMWNGAKLRYEQSAPGYWLSPIAAAHDWHIEFTGTAFALITGVARDAGQFQAAAAGGGADVLDGGAGNDHLYGGEGADVLIGGGGNDTLVGGSGADTFRFARTWQLGVDDGHDRILDADGTDRIELGAGILPENITLSLAGSDLVLTLDVANTLTVENYLEGHALAAVVFADGTVWTAEDIAARLFPAATEGDDVLHGGGGNDTLSGLGGNDSLIAGAGNDRLDGGPGADTMDGGTGDDTYIVDNAGDAVVENANAGQDRVESSVSYTLPDNVEDLVLTGTGNIDGTGNGLGNTLTGNGAANVLAGLGGDDILDGAAGADTLKGGAGNDLYVVDNAGDTVVELSGEGIDTVRSSLSHALAANVENLVLTGSAAIDGMGNELANALTGNAAANILDGGLGADTLAGGAGNDTYVVDDAGDVVIENAGEGTDTVKASVSWTAGENIENVALLGEAAIDATGNALANVLTGNAGDNRLDGRGGNDTLKGGKGDDTYVVDSTADTLIELADEGVNTVESAIGYTLGANLENLVLTGEAAINGTGNALDNRLTGNAAANTLDGGTGADTLAGGAGNDTYLVDNAGDAVLENAGEGVDLVKSGVTHTLSANVENLALTGSAAIDGTGNELANILTGNAAANHLAGGGGDDTLDGGAGADTLIGGEGNDVYVVDNAGDSVIERAGEGVDMVLSSVTHVLSADVENLTLTGSAKINGTGNELANTLTGNAATNRLEGGAGDDTLDGGGGADVLAGGTGDDRYIVDNAGDAVVENAAEGNDTIYAGTTYVLGANVENLVLTGSAAINGTGNTLDNALTGNAANNTLDGGTGADMLIGGAGNDTYVVDNAGDAVIELAGEGVDTVRSGIAYTLSANIENLVLTGSANIDGSGNELSNALTGNGGNNVLDGGLGADTLDGGAGNDTYVVDNAGDMVIEGASKGTDTVRASVAYTLGANLENLTLTGVEAIDGTGNSAGNQLAGNAAANTLYGLAGDDTLDGGAGADTLVGGIGNDTYVVDDAGDVVIENAGEGTDTVKASVSWTAGENIENVTLLGEAAIDAAGNALANVLIGNAGDNVLDGKGGSDVLRGGAGNDTYVLDDNDSVIENAGEGEDTVLSSLTHALAANVENLVLTGALAINGTGNALDNRLTGNAAANTLDGGAGADVMAGGGGDDVYVVDNAGDVVIENAGDGVDLVKSGVTHTLSANVENLVLTGSAAIDGTGNELANVLTGNAAANRLAAGGGDDTLDGGAGADTLIGGAGDDLYIVDNVGDTVLEMDGEGVDLVKSSVTHILAANVENLVLTGSAKINGTGNELANTLTGNAAANRLEGGAGDDTLDGGAGADTLAGGTGDDLYLIDNTGDIVQEAVDAGIDTVLASASFTLAANVENLVLTGTAAINGIGNALDNALTGNAANNTLNGGAGADALTGGAGDDTYVVDNAGDVVTELAGEGVDTVQSSLGWTLGANMENLVLTGSASINGIGNELANTLTGNSGANRLEGGLGDDTLNGGAGSDTLIGGAGDDTYVVDAVTDVVVELAGEGADTVLSSVNWSLGAHLENVTLTGSGSINATGNALANVLTGNGGNNVLDGGLGADTLAGGAGNDTYVVDDAGDVVIEAAGGGTDQVQTALSHSLADNVENLLLTGGAAVDGTGNALDNVLTGNAATNVFSGLEGNDTLDGGAGSDILIGGAGNDTYVVDAADDVVAELAGEGVDTVRASVSWSLGANLENLILTGSAAVDGTGNEFDNTLTGNAAANRLEGGLGNDTLNGGAGADTLIGGAGDDIYAVDNVGDVVTELAGGGVDTVQSTITHALAANVENLVLAGSASINGTGNALDNVLTGNAGNNILDGGQGADTLVGGGGNDTYVVDQAGDTVVESASAGTDTVQSSIDYTLGANVENLALVGAAVVGTGNELANTLVGNAAANTLVGLAGNDTLNGGAGADTLVGGTGNDIYVVDDAADEVVELAGEGTDTIQAGITVSGLVANVENLALTGASAIDGVGNDLDNLITGNGAANRLEGLGGNDTLNGGNGADTLIGGAGNDTLDGGSGNDTYVFGRDDGVDRISEYDSTAGNTDLLSFGTEIDAEQIWLRRVGNDLEVSLIGTADKATLANWYSGTAYRIEQFKTADGEVLLHTQVEMLVQAMAAFAPPAAGQTTLPQNYQDALAPVIAANWR